MHARWQEFIERAAINDEQKHSWVRRSHFKSLQTAHLTYILERAFPLLLKEGTEEIIGLETDEDNKK